MKNKGFTFIELIVSMSLFFLILFPLVKYVQFSFFTNRRYLQLEKSFCNFKAIENQLKIQNYEVLKNSLGNREYNFENFGKDILTQDFFIPYDLDKSSRLNINISEIYYQFEEKKYTYLEIYFTYVNNNKIFKSKNLVNNW